MATERKKQQDRDRMRRKREEDAWWTRDLHLALKAILDEETVPVHVGYDGSGDYKYVEAVRMDSDAIYNAKVLLGRN